MEIDKGIDLTREQNNSFPHNSEINDNSRTVIFVEGNENIIDSDVISGLTQIGRNCLGIGENIAQKYKDIELLVNHTSFMRFEIEEKQKLLESSKVELVKEQDNYDDILNKLNDEIGQISALAIQHEAMNKQTKNLLEQKHIVDQLFNDFDKEFYTMKINGEKVVYMLQDKFNDLKLTMQNVCKIKQEIEDKKTRISNEKICLEEKLKYKSTQLERMQDNLKVKFYRQNAISDYLKTKADEEWMKCSELKCKLKLIKENECQQIKSEENRCMMLEEDTKLTTNKLLQLQQTISEDKARLNQMKLQKINFHHEIESLIQRETDQAEAVSNANNVLSVNRMQIEHFEETLTSKNSIIEENFKLNENLKDMELKVNDLLRTKYHIDNSILEISKQCSYMEAKLESAQKDQQAFSKINYDLNSKISELLKETEELKEQHKHFMNDLQIQKCSYSSQKETLENRISEIVETTKANSNILVSQKHDSLKMKQCLDDNSRNVDVLKKETEELQNYIVNIEDESKVNSSAVMNEIYEKTQTRNNLQAEMNNRFALQTKIDILKGELQVIDCQQRDELKTLKENCSEEMKMEQNIHVNKTKELKSIYKERKAKISELQKEVTKEQNYELNSIKTAQKLTFIYDKNIQELHTLKNAIKTLDVKLIAVVQAVTKSIKEIPLYSQCSSASSAMITPAQKKRTVKRLANDYDSSSSGVSMNEDMTWKKKLLIKQQGKQYFTPVSTPLSCNNSQKLPLTDDTVILSAPKDEDKETTQRNPLEPHYV